MSLVLLFSLSLPWYPILPALFLCRDQIYPIIHLPLKDEIRIHGMQTICICGTKKNKKQQIHFVIISEYIPIMMLHYAIRFEHQQSLQRYMNYEQKVFAPTNKNPNKAQNNFFLRICGYRLAYPGRRLLFWRPRVG